MEMVSACPTCLTMVNHEDHLFEVRCHECGTRFNPYLHGNENSEYELNILVPGPSAMDSPETDYRESNAVFQDIRQFGETLSRPSVEAKSPTKIADTIMAKIPAPNATKLSPIENGTTAPGTPQDCLVTAGDSLQGLQVESYFAPVSTLCGLDSGNANPLGPAMSSLWDQAKSMGANAILSVRWSILPDGTRVVASGTPIRYSRP